MFWVRFRSSVILMIIAITTMVLGGNVLFATVLAISIIGMYELYKIYDVDKKLLGFTGYTACIIYYLLLLFQKEEHIVMLVVLYLLVLMAVYVLSFPKYSSEHLALVFMGLIYVAFMLSFIYRVRIMEGGAYLVWLIFICAWGSDTCAYCVGVKFGKHKMTPKLSPKKSIEGLFGGIIGAALLGLIYATIFKTKISAVENPQVAFMIIGACGSVLSVIGDLAASAIKRNHDIKDYGTLIPGHGGILDRFDSIIFTAPVVFYLIQIL